MFLYSLSAFLQRSPQIAAPRWNASLRFLPTIRQMTSQAETKTHVRTRRVWTEEESKRLLDLVEEHGPRWTFISRFFNNRNAVKCLNRWKLLTQKEVYGPWSEEELDALRKITRGKKLQELDFEKIQKQLPKHRPIPLIRQTWMHTINPDIKHGRWSPEEIKRLDDLIKIYGVQNWDAVAEGMGTRTRRQCIERFRWQHQQDLQKGRFTPEEDLAIIEAVQKYGENFALVKEAIGSKRTARHIASHYQYCLNPNTDRSLWTPEEEQMLYEKFLELKSMKDVKEALGSRRGIKDILQQD
ncbi:hypothetical protein VTP01DRAFT_9151 [Rhizomucor pusillus]|uniref:uncharacterized protein n=1 Tax=Rhizomucor pusillus TaxID=4840 RepID=UPI00374273D3